MFAFLRRYFARRRLKPVVSVLPRQALESFGVSDYCTFGQAKRVITGMHLHKSIEPYAYATACRLSELDKGFPLSADDYQRARAELAELFGLRNSEFTIKDLLNTPYSRYSPAQETYYASNSSG
jgi:uncharacterized protein DUF6559